MTNQQLIAFLKAQPIGVGCAVLSLLLGLGIYFRSDLVPQSEELLDQKATLGERLDANLKNGVQLPEQYAAITAARQQIEARLVHPDELAKNLQFFYKLEADTGTKLVDVAQNQVAGSRKTSGPKLNYLPVGYTLAVRGDYGHILEFLRRLESGQRFCRVNSANLSILGGSDKGRASELTISISLELLGQP